MTLAKPCFSRCVLDKLRLGLRAADPGSTALLRWASLCLISPSHKRTSPRSRILMTCIHSPGSKCKAQPDQGSGMTCMTACELITSSLEAPGLGVLVPYGMALIQESRRARIAEARGIHLQLLWAVCFARKQHVACTAAEAS